MSPSPNPTDTGSSGGLTEPPDHCTPPPVGSALLEMRGISKRFGDVLANDAVDLTLNAGDILGLLGENGAGKTTLMNILFGAYDADAGSIRIDGRAATIRNSADALACGVGMVHQHYHLVGRHNVIENLMVGQSAPRWWLDRTGVRRRMVEIRDRYGLWLDPSAMAGELTVGEQQRLEIIKALIRGARILILDEPTAALTPQETEGLFKALRAMAGNRMGVIFISHKLNEICALTSHIVILRQGRVTTTLVNDACTNKQQLAALMCGREITPPEKPAVTTGAPLLVLKGVTTAGARRRRLKDVSITVHAGEILGIAGVSGNGQKALADVIAGVTVPAEGTLTVGGAPVLRASPRDMQARRVGRIPEDRMGTGLITTLPLSSSMVLSRIRERAFSRLGILKPAAIRRFATRQIRDFGITAAGAAVRTGTLSGGNLQKALLARELAWDPLVLLAAQPTRGLDVSAAQFVHRQFLDLRSRGRAVVLISEDLEELFLLSDRIAVMYEGRIMDTLPIAEATVGAVGLLMAGVREAA
ncbi:MAG: ABC transporter ATP-binding protein [Pseudomonadota bacterium]